MNTFESQQVSDLEQQRSGNALLKENMTISHRKKAREVRRVHIDTKGAQIWPWGTNEVLLSFEGLTVTERTSNETRYSWKVGRNRILSWDWHGKRGCHYVRLAANRDFLLDGKHTRYLEFLKRQWFLMVTTKRWDSCR